MILRWLRRRRLARTAFPAAWEAVLAGQRFFARLDDDERDRLRSIVRVLVTEKNWEGCGGLVLTDEMRVVIAAHAARLILHIDHDHFRRVLSVLVYPTSYVFVRDDLGFRTRGLPYRGHATPQGPVVLAWDAVQETTTAPSNGRNLVLHEFAHVLDMQDGAIDGTPLLADGRSNRIWAEVMKKEHDRRVEQVQRGERSVLDEYGATNRTEFFAVATETFFEDPASLRDERPTLYDLLRRYYGQDPAARLAPRPAVGPRSDGTSG